ALDAVAERLEHLLDEIHRDVSGGFAAHQRPAPARALAREHAGFIAVGHALVLAEQEADLARAHADVASRHVLIFADVMAQRGHEALAEPHDLVLGASLRIEVRTTLGTADGQPRQRVLEHLLEAEELDDAQVNRRVKAQPALVGSEHTVESHPEAAGNLHLAAIILPGHAEDQLALRLADALDDLVLDVFRMPVQHRTQGLDDFLDRLVELDLAGIPAFDLAIDVLDMLAAFQDTCTPYALIASVSSSMARSRPPVCTRVGRPMRPSSSRKGRAGSSSTLAMRFTSHSPLAMSSAAAAAGTPAV